MKYVRSRPKQGPLAARESVRVTRRRMMDEEQRQMIMVEEANLKIIRETLDKRDPISNLRRAYAVYRLYKLGWGFDWLHRRYWAETGLTLQGIRNIVAKVFTMECLASPSCPFREILSKFDSIT